MFRVALRKESVDRNWLFLPSCSLCPVALRKESVDRNCYLDNIEITEAKSLSARRAWIEIVISAMTSQISVVALRKESVDRNFSHHNLNLPSSRRSPQGERG